ncbi:MAG: ErfK/YbiS/YcfS/YnhG family protein [Firmicutes bacterium]|nr:ErfK/YbiS/YcfS/YnhG family protein [Bacillota bacterium]
MNVRTLYLSHRLASIAFEEESEHPLIGEIQQLLLHKNLYQGPIHQKYDTQTIRGITLFQEKENLPATGIVDPLTYCRLIHHLTSPEHIIEECISFLNFRQPFLGDRVY